MQKQKSSSGAARLPSLGKPPVSTKRLPQTSENSRTKESPPGSHLDMIRIRTSIEGEELLCEGINNAIHEYLLRRDMTRTLQTFQTELLARPSDSDGMYSGKKPSDFVKILQSVVAEWLTRGIRGRETRRLLPSLASVCTCRLEDD